MYTTLADAQADGNSSNTSASIFATNPNTITQIGTSVQFSKGSDSWNTMLQRPPNFDIDVAGNWGSYFQFQNYTGTVTLDMGTTFTSASDGIMYMRLGDVGDGGDKSAVRYNYEVSTDNVIWHQLYVYWGNTTRYQATGRTDTDAFITTGAPHGYNHVNSSIVANEIFYASIW